LCVKTENLTRDEQKFNSIIDNYQKNEGKNADLPATLKSLAEIYLYNEGWQLQEDSQGSQLGLTNEKLLYKFLV
jgi:hypothetical protein